MDFLLFALLGHCGKNEFNTTARFGVQIQKRVWVGDLISGGDHFCIRGCQFKSSRENVDGWRERHSGEFHSTASVIGNVSITREHQGKWWERLSKLFYCRAKLKEAGVEVMLELYVHTHYELMSVLQQKTSVKPECLCLWLLWSNDPFPLRLPTATPKRAEMPTSTRKAFVRPRPRRLSVTILMDVSSCARGSALYCCPSPSGALLPLSRCLGFLNRMLQEALPNSLI